MTTRKKAEPEAPLYPVHSVANALALLRMLRDRPNLRVVEVSRDLHISPSTAHRLLSMFVLEGFLRQEGRRAVYTIGPVLVDIATSIFGQLTIESAIRPHLMDLVGKINETAHVCVLSGGNVTFLDCVESSHGIRAVSRVGRSIPAYATASGKALLAELSVRDIENLFPHEDLKRLTRKTLQTRSSLLAELRRIRERGYATNAEESELDFAAFACVVRDAAGLARASIVIAGPTSRLKRYEAGSVAGALKSACAAASAGLSQGAPTVP
jgi:DNA-binding IclR family transcriptional regulator